MGIFGTAVQPPVDASAAAWIAPRLDAFGTVGGLLPDGFEASVVIRPLVLADGCAEDATRAEAIAGVARRHTTTPGRACFAIWEGYGWASGRTFYGVRGHGVRARIVRTALRRRAAISDRRRNERIRRGLARVPQFDLPHRRYFLLCGPVDAAARIVEPGRTSVQVADLWWPEDRSWFVATDTDLEWTYVAGSHALVAALAAALPGQVEPVERGARNSDLA